MFLYSFLYNAYFYNEGSLNCMSSLKAFFMAAIRLFNLYRYYCYIAKAGASPHSKAACSDRIIDCKIENRRKAVGVKTKYACRGCCRATSRAGL